MTPEQRRAAYRARARKHPACGVRTDGTVPSGCLRCQVVEAYLARRQLYLDAVDDSDPSDLAYVPVTPVVTFGWWLRQHPYPPAPPTEREAHP